jgi:hypothetical protein
VILPAMVAESEIKEMRKRLACLLSLKSVCKGNDFVSCNSDSAMDGGLKLGKIAKIGNRTLEI